MTALAIEPPGEATLDARGAAPSFAATKIRPARSRAQTIARPVLDQALLAATRTHRVVLLQAPAGFGKTSALAELAKGLAQADAALAWVSLDAEDDAARLFACLAAALEPFDLPWRTLPDALVAQMHQGSTAARRAVEELLNALAHADVAHGVIVIEDLHRARDADLVGLGDLLIERLPRQWCLVLTSREALALARLRAAGELAEFGAEALRFSADESAALIAAAGLDAAAGAALHERTQGWPAGLRLALLAHASRAGAATARTLGERYLFEYLASEVLDALPHELHNFLLRTSVLPELTAARAGAVSGDAAAALRLDDIERRGLFATPLEAPERTLVLHDLLRDALRSRLVQRLPGELPLLLQRAAATEADPLRRVGYLLQASDWAGAENSLDDAAPALFLHQGPGEVERTLAQFNAQWRAQSVVLAALAAGAALLRWDWDAVRRHAESLQALPAPPAGETLRQRTARERTLGLLAMALYVADRNEASEALIAELRARALAPSARRLMLIADATQHFRRGEHAQVQQLYGAVLDSLETGASLFDWWECVPAANWGTLPGMRRQMQRFVAGASHELRGQPLALRADLAMLQAYDHLWAGRIEAARDAVRAAEDDQRWLACSGETDITVQIFRLIEGAISGRADEVRARLETLRERNRDAAPDRRRLWQHHLAVYGVRISHLLDEPPAVLERWAAWLKEDPLRSAEQLNGRAIAVRLRHAAAQGRWDEAARQYELIEPKLASMDVHAHAVELQLRGAHALLRAGAAATAARAAVPALVRLREEASPGYALMAGPAVLRTLAEGLGAQLEPELARLLVELTTLAESARRGSATDSAASGAAPAAAAAARKRAGLSTREAEVLQLIARGSSNKIIARTLDISPHTVKRHVANILDKLALQSRGEAAAWWHRHP
ncbi:MAG: AAA family ATPase [Burkholderiaceae bacterium]|nr:AAA family ATPase [Burkholderiaceae bacterium]